MHLSKMQTIPSLQVLHIQLTILSSVHYADLRLKLKPNRNYTDNHSLSTGRTVTP